MRGSLLLLGMSLAGIAEASAVVEADIRLGEPSAVYVIQVDGTLAGPQANDLSRYDVIDADGRAMPRGFWQSLARTFFRKEMTPAASSPVLRTLVLEPCSQTPRLSGCAELKSAAPHEARRAEDSSDILEVGRSAMPPLSINGGSGPAPGGGTTRKPAVSDHASADAAANARGNRSVTLGAAGPAAHTASPLILPRRSKVYSFQLEHDAVEALSERTLVLHWRSRLAPQQLWWQIGSNVETISSKDRRWLPSSSDVGEWTWHLAQAWSMPGRFLENGVLHASQEDDGTWRATLRFNTVPKDLPLEVGVAPAEQVELMDLSIVGSAAAYVPALSNDRTITLDLEKVAPSQWRVALPAQTAQSSRAELYFSSDRLAPVYAAGSPNVLLDLVSAANSRQAATLTSDMLHRADASQAGVSIPIRYDPSSPLTTVLQRSQPEIRGSPQLRLHYPPQTLWFENLGTPPYRVRIGGVSPRVRPETPTPDAQARLGLNEGATFPIDLPLADVGSPHPVAGYRSPPAATSTFGRSRLRNIDWGLFVLVAAGLALSGLARLDSAYRQRLLALQVRSS